MFWSNNLRKAVKPRFGFLLDRGFEFTEDIGADVFDNGIAGSASLRVHVVRDRGFVTVCVAFTTKE